MKQPIYMLVDDDPINNMINERMLKNQLGDSIVCEVFLDGKPALNHLNGGASIPDLIFLDINMPVMDGWQFLEEYNNVNCEAPIVMLTSSIDPKDIEKSKKYPCVIDFISKPLMPDVIDKIMSKMEEQNG